MGKVSHARGTTCSDTTRRKGADQLEALIKQFLPISSALANLACAWFFQRDMNKARRRYAEADSDSEHCLKRRGEVAAALSMMYRTYKAPRTQPILWWLMRGNSPVRSNIFPRLLAIRDSLSGIRGFGDQGFGISD